MSQQTKNIDSILSNEDSSLGKLVQRAKALNTLEEQLESVFLEFKGRYKIGTYEKGILTLLTDNASTATELRYKTPDILESLRQDWYWSGLIKIQIKVHHHWHDYQEIEKSLPTPPPAEPLSAKTIKSFETLIDQLGTDTKHKALVKALNRILLSQEKLKNNQR